MLETAPYGEASAALLPIKPKYAEKILTGEKRVEFRKVDFKRDINRIIIYSSSPVKRIVAICDVKQIKKYSPSKLWEMYKSIGGISLAEYTSYYHGKKYGIAIEIENIRVLKKPIKLEDVVYIKSVPQSFMYIDCYIAENISREGLSIVHP